MSTAIERVWAQTDRAGDDECWIWRGRTKRYKGHGMELPEINVKSRNISPRRVVWEDTHGEPFPPKRQAAVSCGNPLCLNPKHIALKPYMDHEVRFWSFVKKADGDACWEWQSTFFTSGYATFRMHGKQLRASRVAWEFTYGPIVGHVPGDPEREICVCHRCDNPKCVRPDHLFLGSDKDNHDDMVRKGRHAHGPALSQAVKRARENMKQLAAKAMGEPCSSPATSTEGKR